MTRYRFFDHVGEELMMSREAPDISAQPVDQLELEGFPYNSLSKYMKDATGQTWEQKDILVEKLGQGGFNSVFLIRNKTESELERSSLVLRISLKASIEVNGREWSHRKMFFESNLLRFLSEYQLPVPRSLYCCCDKKPFDDCPTTTGEEPPQEPVPSSNVPFMLMEYVPGFTDEWMLPEFSHEEKLRMCEEYADFAYRLTLVPVTQDQGIGSLTQLNSNTALQVVGPLLDPILIHRQMNEKKLLSTPFTNDHDLMMAYIPPHSDQSTFQPTHSDWAALIAQLQPPRTDTICHRLVLAHLDISTSNLQTHHGVLNAVLDWEFHGVLPFYFAAEDLPWLRYDGIQDAGRFAPLTDRGFSISLWPERREQAQQYIDHYKTEVQKRDGYFLHAMTWGRPMRQLREWLRHWKDEKWYIDAFEKWYDHIRSFQSLEELVHSCEWVSEFNSRYLTVISGTTTGEDVQLVRKPFER